MIDLHTHILPGLDDGAKSLDEALQMARVAAADGIRTVAATSHFGFHLKLTWPAIVEAVDALNQALVAEALPLRVAAAAEITISPEVLDVLERNGALTINGSRYALTELPFDQYPLYTERVLFEMQLRGIVPIIAHPERNSQIIKDPDILGRLVQRGALAQITTTSLLGGFGGATKRAAEHMLKHNMAHFLASDAHSPKDRRPELSQAAERAAKLIGQEAARTLVQDNPASVIADEIVSVPEPVLRQSSWR